MPDDQHDALVDAPRLPMLRPPTPTLTAKLEARYIPEPNSGCWLWIGHVNALGYGRVHHEDRGHYAHRLAFVLFKGSIPSGLILDHKCRNSGCINPDHLEAVTQGENVRRGLVSITQTARHFAQTHCRHGHPFDKKNTRINPDGRRACRACSRRNALAWYHRNRGGTHA